MKSNYLILVVVSSTLLLNMALTNKNSIFDSENFEKIVQAPLQCATFLSLTFYLFNCGLKKDEDQFNRGGKFGIPLSLLMTSFKNASFYNMNNKKTFTHKMIGFSILYGSFISGSLISKNKGLPIKTIKDLI